MAVVDVVDEFVVVEFVVVEVAAVEVVDIIDGVTDCCTTPTVVTTARCMTGAVDSTAR